MKGKVSFIIGDIEVAQEHGEKMKEDGVIQEYFPSVTPNHITLLLAFALLKAEDGITSAIPVTSIDDFKIAMTNVIKSNKENLLGSSVIVDNEIFGSNLSDDEVQAIFLDTISTLKGNLS